MGAINAKHMKGDVTEKLMDIANQSHETTEVVGLFATEETFKSAVQGLLDEATPNPRTEGFARSIVAGGVVLRVRAETEARQALARSTLKKAGGANARVHGGEGDNS